MKNYFGFTLTGHKLLPVWISLYLFFIAPYVALVIYFIDNSNREMIDYAPSHYILMMVLAILIMLCILFVILFFITKLLIENISYNGVNLHFDGTLTQYLGLIFLNLFLTIITLCIYLPWFIKKMHRFFINHTYYGDEAFAFKGRGRDLLVIYIMTLIVPFLIFDFFSFSFLLATSDFVTEHVFSYFFIRQCITWIIMIPYMYFSYKWLINVDYKNYHIRWNTNTGQAIGKLFIEMLFCIITFGIYLPMFYVKMYGYFLDRTIADNGETIRNFGFEKNNFNDFLFLWGQILLTIITLGIYYPWAISKIGERFLSRTYLE